MGSVVRFFRRMARFLNGNFHEIVRYKCFILKKIHRQIINVILSLCFIGKVIYHLKDIKTMGKNTKKKETHLENIFTSWPKYVDEFSSFVLLWSSSKLHVQKYSIIGG